MKITLVANVCVYPFMLWEETSTLLLNPVSKKTRYDRMPSILSILGHRTAIEFPALVNSIPNFQTSPHSDTVLRVFCS